MTYFKRHIDDKLREWKTEARRKPLLIRGARQVGKSTAVRELGKQFRYFVEVNLEKQPDQHYWQNHVNNSQAEVDYLKVSNGKILPKPARKGACRAFGFSCVNASSSMASAHHLRISVIFL